MASGQRGSLDGATIRFYLEAFYPYVVETVRATDIVCFFSLFSKDEEMDIKKLFKSDPPGATRKALDYILCMEDKPDRFHTLLDALSDSGYTRVVQVLTGEDFPDEGHSPCTHGEKQETDEKCHRPMTSLKEGLEDVISPGQSLTSLKSPGNSLTSLNEGLEDVKSPGQSLTSLKEVLEDVKSPGQSLTSLKEGSKDVKSPEQTLTCLKEENRQPMNILSSPQPVSTSPVSQPNVRDLQTILQTLSIGATPATSKSQQDPVAKEMNCDLSQLVAEMEVIYERKAMLRTEELQESDDTDSDSDNNLENLTDKPVELYPFQQELAAPALHGKNCMIVSPPNTGKTIIAIKVIQEHMLKTSRRIKPKAIFLVNQVNLANQQVERCREYLGQYRPKVISGETQRVKGHRLKDFLHIRDVFVVTAQIFLDALTSKDVESITDFSLIVFDECHHAHDSHAYNGIMGVYLDLAHSGNANRAHLPQILGLTASPGVDKADSVLGAMKHIKHVMANLDTPVLCTVQAHRADLQGYVGKPEIEFCMAPRRQGDSDKFGQVITKLMETIEKLAARYNGAERAAKALPDLCSKTGSEQYIQWLSNLKKFIDTVIDDDHRRYLMACHNHLEMYNTALLVYDDARVEDAVAYLKSAIQDQLSNRNMDALEKKLFDCFQRVIAMQFDGNSVNPKLEKLKEVVLSELKGGDFRGIVFVKRRTLAGSLISWMKCTPGLAELNAEEFVGQGSTADRGGMTRHEQFDVLDKFRKGVHKLLVATSIAEEGLDIVECKFVVRYEHVTNEISMIQSKGRSRARTSKYFIVTSETSGIADKEILNMRREELMYEAIQRVQLCSSANPDRFAEEIVELQQQAMLDKQLKATKRSAALEDSSDYEIACRTCGTFLCMASDIRKVQNAHHVVIDETFSERVEFQQQPDFDFHDIVFVGKTYCTCHNDLGTRCRYKGVLLPVLKVVSLLVKDKFGDRRSFKKWKKVCFAVQPLETEELVNMVKNLE